MSLLNINIDNKNYTYIDAIVINNKGYVAFKDENNIFISEYTLEDGSIFFNDVDDNTYNMVIKEMKL